MTLQPVVILEFLKFIMMKIILHGFNAVIAARWLMIGVGGAIAILVFGKILRNGHLRKIT